jgi:hypothetical protein
MDCDIYGLCETHLSGNQELHIDGYKWIGINRTVVNKRATKGSGGVGFLIKEWIYNDYDVRIHVSDESMDGMLWIILTESATNQQMNLCMCYAHPGDHPIAKDNYSMMNCFGLCMSISHMGHI